MAYDMNYKMQENGKMGEWKKLCTELLGERFHNVELRIAVYEDSLVFNVYYGTTALGKFIFRVFLGNERIVISTDTHVTRKYRRMGIATALQEIKKRVATDLEFTTMLCTVSSENEPQKELLNKLGWSYLCDVGNRKDETSYAQLYSKVV